MKELNPWYYKDRFISSSDLFISWSHPTVQWGWGVFTTGRISNGLFEAGSIHIDRLIRDARSLLLTHPTKEDILHRVELWLSALPQDGFIKVKLSIIPPDGTLIFSSYVYEEASSRRWKLYHKPSDTLHPRTKGYAQKKTHSYVDYLVLKRKAQQLGFDDALLSSEDGFLLETSSCSFFFSHEKTFFFPAYSDTKTLDSITKHLLIKGLKKIAAKIVPWKGKLQDIPNNASCYCINCLYHITAVEQIMDRTFHVNFEEKDLLLSTLQKELVITGVAPCS